MKRNIFGPILAVVLLAGLWGIIYTPWLILPTPVSAHEAKLIPLAQQPEAGNDTYGLYNNQTLNVSAPGLLSNDLLGVNPTLHNSPSKGNVTINPDGAFTYQPYSNVSGTDTFTYKITNGALEDEALVTLEFRSIVFREDTNEITKGECVDFSWLVKGDIDYIEFEIFDDNKNPYLVSQPSGDRQECPVKDTRYQLIVRWLDGTSDKDSKIDIKVEESSGSSSGSSGSSSGEVVVVEGTVAPVGPFYLVTPVLITNAPGIALVPTSVAATPVPNLANFTAPKPTGVLGSVSVLPQTGALPSFDETPVPRSAIIRPEGSHSMMTQTGNEELWPMSIFRMGIFLGTTLVGLALLVKLLRQSG